MPKTNFENGTILTPEHANGWSNHVHNGEDKNGSAPKIRLNQDVAGVLPAEHQAAHRHFHAHGFGEMDRMVLTANHDLYEGAQLPPFPMCDGIGHTVFYTAALINGNHSTGRAQYLITLRLPIININSNYFIFDGELEDACQYIFIPTEATGITARVTVEANVAAVLGQRDPRFYGATLHISGSVHNEIPRLCMNVIQDSGNHFPVARQSLVVMPTTITYVSRSWRGP